MEPASAAPEAASGIDHPQLAALLLSAMCRTERLIKLRSHVEGVCRVLRHNQFVLLTLLRTLCVPGSKVSH